METEEDIIARHRKEKKALQTKIAHMKHSVSKTNKKLWKETIAKATELEDELNSKHEQELAEFRKNFGTNEGSEAPATENNASSNDNDIATQVSERLQVSAGDKKVESSADDDDEDEKIFKPNGLMKGVAERNLRLSKAQKRREKKAAKEKQLREEIERQEAENVNHVRTIEINKMKALLEPRGLKIHEIPSDGDCLFAAIGHQLEQQGIRVTIPELRKLTAQIMLEQPNEYLPFLTSEKTNDSMTPSEYEDYCRKMATTKEWGSQIELKALSQLFGVKIEVIQADGPSNIINDEKRKVSCKSLSNPASNQNIPKPLYISYHRHQYQLGEHFNSLVPA